MRAGAVKMALTLVIFKGDNPFVAFAYSFAMASSLFDTIPRVPAAIPKPTLFIRLRRFIVISFIWVLMLFYKIVIFLSPCCSLLHVAVAQYTTPVKPSQHIRSKQQDKYKKT